MRIDSRASSERIRSEAAKAFRAGNATVAPCSSRMVRSGLVRGTTSSPSSSVPVPHQGLEALPAVGEELVVGVEVSEIEAAAPQLLLKGGNGRENHQGEALA